MLVWMVVFLPVTLGFMLIGVAGYVVGTILHAWRPSKRTKNLKASSAEGSKLLVDQIRFLFDRDDFALMMPALPTTRENQYWER